MKDTLLIICMVLSILSCNPQNKNFNAFDKEFRFHQGFRIDDHDTIIGECGYWNLTNRNDGSYYQFFVDEPEIVAKGFDIYLDVTKVDTNKVLTDDHLFEIMKSNPIDLIRLEKELSKLDIIDVRYVKKFGNVQDMVSGEERMDPINSLGVVYKNDSIYLTMVDTYIEGNKLIRRISYFNGR